MEVKAEEKKIYSNREDFLFELKKKIETLNVQEQIGVLKMMISENVNISENNNGSFINISSLKDKFLFKIYNFVEIKIKQVELFNDVEKIKENMKKEFMN